MKKRQDQARLRLDLEIEPGIGALSKQQLLELVPDLVGGNRMHAKQLNAIVSARAMEAAEDEEKEYLRSMGLIR